MGDRESDVVVDLPLLGELKYREIHALEDGFYRFSPIPANTTTNQKYSLNLLTDYHQ